MGMEGKCIRIRVRIRNAQAAQCTVGVVEGTVKGVCTWNYWLYMELLVIHGILGLWIWDYDYASRV